MTTTSTDMIQLHAYLNGFALGGLVDSLNLATFSNDQGPLLPRLMAEGQGYDLTRSENIAKATCLWMGRYRPASACADSTDKLHQHYVGIEMTGNDLLDYFV